MNFRKTNGKLQETSCLRCGHPMVVGTRLHLQKITVDGDEKKRLTGSCRTVVRQEGETKIPCDCKDAIPPRIPKPTPQPKPRPKPDSKLSSLEGAENKGYEAGLAGISKNLCPYTGNNVARYQRAWIKGWERGNAERVIKHKGELHQT